MTGSNRHSALLLTLVGLFFIARGLATVFLLPLWEGFDEQLHYSYTAYLSRTGKIPLSAALSIPKEVEDSLVLFPGASWSGHKISFKEFWSRPRPEMSSNLLAVKNDFRFPFTMKNWQAQHPPLYYALLSPFYALLDGQNLVRSAQILRIVSLLIASLGLIPAYFLCRIFLDQGTTILALLFFSCFPATFIMFGHITNDCLAFPLFTLLIFLTFQHYRNGITYGLALVTGIILGLGAIAKLYILSVVPVITFLYAIRFLNAKDQRIKIILSFSLLLSVALAISGFWFGHNSVLYGTWNSTAHSVATKDLNLLEKIGFLKLVDWKSFLISSLCGMFWAGNWSFVTFPAAVYLLCGFVMICLFASYCVWAIRVANGEISSLNLLLLFNGTFLLAMIQHQLQIRASGDLLPMGGWYWTALLPTHIIFCFCVTRFIFRRIFFFALTLTLLAIYTMTIWGNLDLLLPHYTGFLEKSETLASGFNAFPFWEALRRISVFSSVSPALLPSLWIAEIGLFFTILTLILKQQRNKLETIPPDWAAPQL